jgi:hypothetical protein
LFSASEPRLSTLHCGLLTTRDHASAMEVLRLGLSLQPLTAVQ